MTRHPSVYLCLSNLLLFAFSNHKVSAEHELLVQYPSNTLQNLDSSLSESNLDASQIVQYLIDKHLKLNCANLNGSFNSENPTDLGEIHENPGVSSESNHREEYHRRMKRCSELERQNKFLQEFAKRTHKETVGTAALKEEKPHHKTISHTNLETPALDSHQDKIQQRFNTSQRGFEITSEFPTSSKEQFDDQATKTDQSSKKKISLMKQIQDVVEGGSLKDLERQETPESSTQLPENMIEYITNGINRERGSRASQGMSSANKSQQESEDESFQLKVEEQARLHEQLSEHEVHSHINLTQHQDNRDLHSGSKTKMQSFEGKQPNLSKPVSLTSALKSVQPKSKENGEKVKLDVNRNTLHHGPTNSTSQKNKSQLSPTTFSVKKKIDHSSYPKHPTGSKSHSTKQTSKKNSKYNLAAGIQTSISTQEPESISSPNNERTSSNQYSSVSNKDQRSESYSATQSQNLKVGEEKSRSDHHHTELPFSTEVLPFKEYQTPTPIPLIKYGDHFHNHSTQKGEKSNNGDGLHLNSNHQFTEVPFLRTEVRYQQDQESQKAIFMPITAQTLYPSYDGQPASISTTYPNAEVSRLSIAFGSTTQNVRTNGKHSHKLHTTPISMQTSIAFFPNQNDITKAPPPQQRSEPEENMLNDRIVLPQVETISQSQQHKMSQLTENLDSDSLQNQETPIPSLVNIPTIHSPTLQNENILKILPEPKHPSHHFNREHNQSHLSDNTTSSISKEISPHRHRLLLHHPHPKKQSDRSPSERKNKTLHVRENTTSLPLELHSTISDENEKAPSENEQDIVEIPRLSRPPINPNENWRFASTLDNYYERQRYRTTPAPKKIQPICPITSPDSSRRKGCLPSSKPTHATTSEKSRTSGYSLNSTITKNYSITINLSPPQDSRSSPDDESSEYDESPSAYYPSPYSPYPVPDNIRAEPSIKSDEFTEKPSPVLTSNSSQMSDDDDDDDEYTVWPNNFYQIPMDVGVPPLPPQSPYILPPYLPYPSPVESILQPINPIRFIPYPPYPPLVRIGAQPSLPSQYSEPFPMPPPQIDLIDDQPQKPLIFGNKDAALEIPNLPILNTPQIDTVQQEYLKNLEPPNNFTSEAPESNYIITAHHESHNGNNESRRASSDIPLTTEQIKSSCIGENCTKKECNNVYVIQDRSVEILDIILRFLNITTPKNNATESTEPSILQSSNPKENSMVNNSEISPSDLRIDSFSNTKDMLNSIRGTGDTGSDTVQLRKSINELSASLKQRRNQEYNRLYATRLDPNVGYGKNNVAAIMKINEYIELLELMLVYLARDPDKLSDENKNARASNDESPYPQDDLQRQFIEEQFHYVHPKVLNEFINVYKRYSRGDSYNFGKSTRRSSHSQENGSRSASRYDGIGKSLSQLLHLRALLPELIHNRASMYRPDGATYYN